jgi:uncharacterized protein (TIGR04376 family)
MTLFDDLNQFLEERFDEFLRNNPHLELQALEEQLREQERDTRQLLAQLQSQEKTLETKILDTAREVQLWHQRIQKAEAVKRFDLVRPAQEREAALLRQGNQLWGQMQAVKGRIPQTQALLQQIQQRQKEVKAKAAEFKTRQASPPPHNNSWDKGWNRASDHRQSSPGTDPLEAKFQRWEMDEELEQLKRQMNP